MNEVKMVDKQQSQAYAEKFPEDARSVVYKGNMSSKIFNTNTTLKTAEEMAMELLLERVFKLEKRVLELESRF